MQMRSTALPVLRALAATLVCLLGTALAQGPIAAAAPKPGYALVWSDEFDGKGAPEANSWMFESGFVRNEELQWYQPDNAYQANGLLVIEARRETRKNPRFQAGHKDWRRAREHIRYTSACLRTHGRRSWRYGIFEVRARIRCDAGLWPAIWLLGAAPGWPASGEIDLMEFYAGDVLANVAWAGTNGAVWNTSKTAITELAQRAGTDVTTWSQQFHVWRLDWNQQRIELSVDGQVLNTTQLQDVQNVGSSHHPFHQPHELLLNLAIGGKHGGDAEQTPFPSRYEIDYVRVYQKPEHRMPRVLLLGDSISIGYTQLVRELMASEAEIVRPTLTGPRSENCEGTSKGMHAFQRWLELGGGDFDVIHFNFGLHDLKRVDAKTKSNSNSPDDPHQADPDTYERQLRKITKALAATGAKLVFATTTPVPQGGVRPHREVADVAIYNERARRVMAEFAVGINDLYMTALPRLDEIQRPIDVHFRAAGNRMLAAEVARHLRAAIAKR